MFWRLPRDDRDLRDKLRIDIMGLAIQIGSDRVLPTLLDEAMVIARVKSIRAARRHIASAALRLGNTVEGDTTGGDSPAPTAAR